MQITNLITNLKEKNSKKNLKITFTPSVRGVALGLVGTHWVSPEKKRVGRRFLDLIERGAGRSTS
jgi:hypothetical protein